MKTDVKATVSLEKKPSSKVSILLQIILWLIVLDNLPKWVSAVLLLCGVLYKWTGRKIIIFLALFYSFLSYYGLRFLLRKIEVIVRVL